MTWLTIFDEPRPLNGPLVGYHVGLAGSTSATADRRREAATLHALWPECSIEVQVRSLTWRGGSQWARAAPRGPRRTPREAGAQRGTPRASADETHGAALIG